MRRRLGVWSGARCAAALRREVLAEDDPVRAVAGLRVEGDGLGVRFENGREQAGHVLLPGMMFGGRGQGPADALTPVALEHHRVDLRGAARDEDLMVGRVGFRTISVMPATDPDSSATSTVTSGAAEPLSSSLKYRRTAPGSGSRWPTGSSPACRSALARRSWMSAGTSSGRAGLTEIVTVIAWQQADGGASAPVRDGRARTGSRRRRRRRGTRNRSRSASKLRDSKAANVSRA
jgi:hypothetical protein